MSIDCLLPSPYSFSLVPHDGPGIDINCGSGEGGGGVGGGVLVTGVSNAMCGSRRGKCDRQSISNQ